MRIARWALRAIDIGRRVLVVLGAIVLTCCALIVFSAFAPKIAYLGVLGSSGLSPYGPWLIVLPLAAFGLCWAASRHRRGRRLLVLAAIGVSASIGASIAVAQMVNAAHSAGVSIDVAKALTLSTVFEPVPLAATEQYGQYESDVLHVAIYPHVGQPGRLAPVLVYIHGGGFVAGLRTDHAQDMRWFADKGWWVVSIDYPLSSESRHLWDQTSRDIGCALVWVAENSARFGADASRLSLIGESAGGNLVLNAAYRANQGSLPSSCGGSIPHVAAVSALYPVVDLAGVYANPDAALGSFSRRLATYYTGGTPEQYPDRYASVTPASYLSSTAPPTFILVGESDHLVPPAGAYAFAARARQAGVDVRLVGFPFGEHGFDRMNGSIGNQLFRQATYDFLKAHQQAP